MEFVIEGYALSRLAQGSEETVIAYGVLLTQSEELLLVQATALQSAAEKGLTAKHCLYRREKMASSVRLENVTLQLRRSEMPVQHWDRCAAIRKEIFPPGIRCQIRLAPSIPLRLDVGHC